MSFGLLPVTIYGENLGSQGFIPPICIASQKINQFLVHPMKTFPFALSFYLWYALVKKDANIEKKCSRYISSFIWLSAIIHAVCLITASRNEENFGTKVESYLCVINKRAYSMLLIIIIFTLLFTIAMSSHSGVILFKRWKDFNLRQNRTRVIKLGHALRLFIFSFFYINLLLFSVIFQVMELGHNSDIWSWGFTFSGPLLGILLWSIFGTSKKAAIFLPCYYVTPVSSYDFSQEHMTVIDHLSDNSTVIDHSSDRSITTTTETSEENGSDSRNSRNVMLEKEDE
ncbi:hypothetical protein Glove_283g21 [Diversispora epigaea]|uniref:G-protein coupled receptors family 2 profile 2 domain-containing protein n=1 Tax=Diversispora epigaea TaxID=1348612 RepID=A0A397I9M6_9GLOM|nr:hypothetical protein Glove_283g21 [Diversispora epigaea]